MLANIVDIVVDERFIDKFIKLTTENHLASILEPGILRFDFMQSNDFTNHFILYEVYKNEEAVLQHKDTKHYKIWRDSVQDIMKTQRKTTHYSLIKPNFDM